MVEFNLIWQGLWKNENISILSPAKGLLLLASTSSTRCQDNMIFVNLHQHENRDIFVENSIKKFSIQNLWEKKAGQILRSKIAFNFLTSTILTHFNLTNLNLFVPYKVEAHHLARGFAKSNRDGGKSVNLGKLLHN